LLREEQVLNVVRMFLLRSVLLVLLALASNAFGTVLIYKGTGKAIGKSNAFVEGPVSHFVLIDPSTKQVASVCYYVRNKQKFRFNTSPAVYRRVSFTLLNGQASLVYQFLLSADLNGEYASAITSIRGNSAALKTSTTGIIPVLHPKALTFTNIAFSDLDDSKQSSELRTTLRFQQTRTITANDANQTIQAAFDALMAELEAKGY
jgi:hypothetical protein